MFKYRQPQKFIPQTLSSLKVDYFLLTRNQRQMNALTLRSWRGRRKFTSIPSCFSLKMNSVIMVFPSSLLKWSVRYCRL